MKETKQKEIGNIEADREIFTAKEHIAIPDGKHEGRITEILIRAYEEYKYVDIYVQITDMDDIVEMPIIKFGVNASISDMSKLGMLMMKAGFKFKSGDEITFRRIRELMINRSISFKTISIARNVKGQKMEFADIIYETVEFN